MTLVNGIWYDNELGKYKLFADEIKSGLQIKKPHKLGIEPNSDGIQIVKCIVCHRSRMSIIGLGIYNCDKPNPTEVSHD